MLRNQGLLHVYAETGTELLVGAEMLRTAAAPWFGRGLVLTDQKRTPEARSWNSRPLSGAVTCAPAVGTWCVAWSATANGSTTKARTTGTR